MKNTHTIYTSDERTPIVNPEMQDLLPKLNAEEYAALEADILANGSYTPITVNQDMTIIDGHHRFQICQKHGLPFQMQVFEFGDLLEAKQWALDTQKARRNLDLWQLGQIALRLKPDVVARAKANQGNRTDLSADVPESFTPVDTRKELAQAVGIGERTMGKIMKLTEDAPDAIREAVASGEMSIGQGYNINRQVQKLPEEEWDQAAKAAIEASLQKSVKALDTESTRRKKIAQSFCTAFEKSITLKPTTENLRYYVEYTRMFPSEIEDKIEEADEIAEIFQTIRDRLRDEILATEPRWKAANAEQEECA